MVMRYFIALAIIVTIGVSVRNSVEYVNLDSDIKEEALHQAKNIMEVINLYTKSYDSIIESTDIVIDQSNYLFIPAHAHTHIRHKDYSEDSHEIFTRNVTKNAANRKNLATEDETKIIENMQKNSLGEIFTSASLHNKEYYVLACPIYVKPMCLMCHGRRENAPEFVQKSNEAGFVYEVGDIRAITTVYVDKKSFSAEFYERYHKRVIASTLTALSVILLLYLAVREISKKEEKLIELLKESSSKDALTSLANRRTLDKAINNAHLTLLETKTPYSLLLFDIDFFKKINDTHGHLTGDKVLIKISKLFASNIQENLTLGRWGGEEFLIILPNYDEKSAFTLAQKLRELVEQSEFQKGLHVTVSCGVYEVQSNNLIDDSISYVDKALYSAKESGRNRVCIYKAN